MLLYESLKNKAVAIFNLIVDMRYWNASFNGVYVKSETIEPNPYLNPSYIEADNHKKLIWINPAFMTRQISDIASKREGFSLKITSDKLINPNNAPNNEEKKILDFFKKNPNNPYYWEIKENTFLFMGALKVEADCLKCHQHQGYKIGDIRGGISVSFDATEEFGQLSIIKNTQNRAIFFLVIATFGTTLFFILYLRKKIKDEKEISNLNKALKTKVKELDEFNLSLNNKVKIELDKQREKERLLIQQSKMASMGEMIGNIAHQWRQPISAVSAIIMNIKYTAIANGVEKTFLDESIQEANKQLQYMSQTIDDFRNFFKPEKEKEKFNLNSQCLKAYRILEATLQSYDIKFELIANNDYFVYGYSSEFSQVILNLLSNAKDIFVKNNQTDGKIEISIYDDKENIICEVKDNAGGIEPSIIDKIFEPYFTTKQTNGTGIGLYISKEIIEKHMQGLLTVRNCKNGAKFTISLQKN